MYACPPTTDTTPVKLSSSSLPCRVHSVSQSLHDVVEHEMRGPGCAISDGCDLNTKLLIHNCCLTNTTGLSVITRHCWGKKLTSGIPTRLLFNSDPQLPCKTGMKVLNRTCSHTADALWIIIMSCTMLASAWTETLLAFAWPERLNTCSFSSSRVSH